MNVAPEPVKPAKNHWTDPKILVLGGVDAFTLGRNKDYGTGDAFTFENQSTRLSQ